MYMSSGTSTRNLAVDQSASTCSRTNQATNQWMVFELDRPVEITEVQIRTSGEDSHAVLLPSTMNRKVMLADICQRGLAFNVYSKCLNAI